MEKEIYEMLNQINTDLSEYEEVQFSNFERKKNQKRILSKTKNKANYKSMKFGRLGNKLAVVGMILVGSIICATSISYASNGKYFDYLYTFFNGSGVIYQEGKDESSMTVGMNDTENPPVELIDGNLYFIVDGNKLDITNMISDSKPYIGEVVDQQGIIHKFIIGGNAVEGEYGYEECIFKSNGEFIASSGRYPSPDESVPEWLNTGRIDLGLTWY